MTLHLSRLRLSRDPSVEALSALLAPRDPSKAADANHRLIWSAFAGDPAQTRDFLWRAEGKGLFYVLSARPPVASPFFEPPEVKPFAPDLRPGDRLTFVLRANATRTQKTGQLTVSGKERKVHIDLVMDRLRPIPGQTVLEKGAVSERPALRIRLAQAAAADWLAGQGARHGFTLPERPTRDGMEPDLTVSDYSVFALPHHVGKRAGQPQFGILDLTGTLEMTDPAAFLDALAHGFGRAKAFGCGLMLIRRAPS